MNRRNFLTGTIGGVVSSGLIIKASDADIKAFAHNKGPVELVAPESAFSELGHIVFNSSHKPIGVIVDVKMNREMTDVSFDSESWAQYQPGAVTMTILAKGYTDIRIR